MLYQVTLPFALLTLKIFAFDIKSYNTKECTGQSDFLRLNLINGCNKAPAFGVQAIIMPWGGEPDNNRLLATYSTESCCHADLIDTYGWEDKCTPFNNQGVKSWRVIDPEDPDRGVEKERSKYACDNCGLDGCGPDAIWVSEGTSA
jgi:hypothetical protein